MQAKAKPWLYSVSIVTGHCVKIIFLNKMHLKITKNLNLVTATNLYVQLKLVQRLIAACFIYWFVSLPLSSQQFPVPTFCWWLDTDKCGDHPIFELPHLKSVRVGHFPPCSDTFKSSTAVTNIDWMIKTYPANLPLRKLSFARWSRSSKPQRKHPTPRCCLCKKKK